MIPRSIALALALIACACAGTKVRGKTATGRYTAQDESWSIALPPYYGQGFQAYAHDARDERASGFTAGDLDGPRWAVVVHDKAAFREPYRELDDFGEDLCLAAYHIGHARDARPPEAVVHGRRTKIADRPADLRVYARGRLPTDEGDVDDLFHQERAPRELVVVYALDCGERFALFRMEMHAPWSAYGVRPSLRMALEEHWDELTAWVESFRLEPRKGA